MSIVEKVEVTQVIVLAEGAHNPGADPSQHRGHGGVSAQSAAG